MVYQCILLAGIAIFVFGANHASVFGILCMALEILSRNRECLCHFDKDGKLDDMLLELTRMDMIIVVEYDGAGFPFGRSIAGEHETHTHEESGTRYYIYRSIDHERFWIMSLILINKHGRQHITPASFARTSIGYFIVPMRIAFVLIVMLVTSLI
jgi:hypothetical protein